MKVVRPALDRWQANGELPTDLPTLRAMLYFMQRAHRHQGVPEPFTQAGPVKEVVAAIRGVSGGYVDIGGRVPDLPTTQPGWHNYDQDLSGGNPDWDENPNAWRGGDPPPR